MEKELVLGIDYGGKYTGIAVVDRRNNQVLYARTVKMRDDITKTLKDRREQRGIRRTGQTKKKRLRELKNYLTSIGYDESTELFKSVYSLCHKRGYDYADMPTYEELEEMDEKERKEWEETQRNSRHREEVLKDVREIMVKEGATDEQVKRVEQIFNKQYRQKRFNNRILTKCKVEDCGANTPLRKNARDLLIENIVRFLPLIPVEKEELKASAIDKDGREKVKAFFRRHKIDEHLRKQIYDIAYNPKLPGRTIFCKKHILEHIEHTKEERKVFRLAPSLKTKIENVLVVIKDEILPKFTFNKVIMESNNFDISAKTRGKKRLAKNEYSKGHKEGKETILEVLLKETNNRCIYCGKTINLSNANKDHIYPKKAGGINIFANLVACCRECNDKKRGRTPLESGVLPHPEMIAYMGNDLKKKILEDARNIKTLDFNKYMSLASIGWRHMRDRLRELTGNEKLSIERQSGIYTAYFRRWWGFKKERGNDKHHALDAVILASRKGYTDEGLVDMILKPIYKDGGEFDSEKHLPEKMEFQRDKGSRGSALHDRNPLSYKNDAITRRFMVTEIECGKENTVVSEEYGMKLTQAFKHFGTANGKCLTDVQAKESGFFLRKSGDRTMSLKCHVRGTGPGQMVKIKNNVFKTNVHNIGVAVYADEKGKKMAYELKNPRLLKHFVEPIPPAGGRMLFTFKRGDLVTIEGEDDVYRIKKLGASPVIEAVHGDKKTRTVSATKLTKVFKK